MENPESTILSRKVKVGMYIVIEERPCKVTQVLVSKTGKHGYSKVYISGVDIFTQVKRTLVMVSWHVVQIANVIQYNVSLIDIDEHGICILFSDYAGIKDNLKIPDNELGNQIKQLFDSGQQVEVCIMSCLNIEMIMSYKIFT